MDVGLDRLSEALTKAVADQDKQALMDLLKELHRRKLQIKQNPVASGRARRHNSTHDFPS